jgi:hypothetical protein
MPPKFDQSVGDKGSFPSHTQKPNSANGFSVQGVKDSWMTAVWMTVAAGRPPQETTHHTRLGHTVQRRPVAAGHGVLIGPERWSTTSIVAGRFFRCGGHDQPT